MPPPSDAFLRASPQERRVPDRGIVHLAFVGQINLQDVHEFDVESLLPPSGMLSFFYNPQVFASDTGAGPAQAHDRLSGFSYSLYGYDNIDNWQVIYVDSAEGLTPREFPDTLHEGIRYQPHTLTVSDELTLPSLETSYFPRPNSEEGRVDLTADEWQVYGQLRYDLRANVEIHQLLGFADQWSTTVDEGSYWRLGSKLRGDDRTWGDVPVTERLQAAESIRLLLQVGTFDRSAHWWGRNGTLYFFIRESDLLAREFTKVWGAEE